MAKVQLYFSGKLLAEYPLEAEITTIGRRKDNDIVIDNKGVSGQHAQIRKQGETYVLEDLDSTNGTRLNKQKIKSATLTEGDKIILFKYTLIFVQGSLLAENTGSKPNRTSVSINGDETLVLDVQQLSALTRPDTKSNGQIPSSDRIDTDKTGKQLDQYQKQHERLTHARLEVTSADEIKTIYLDNKAVLIGRKSDCDVHTGGWFFTPAISAVIKKDMSGHYTINPMTKIKVNDEVTIVKKILNNEDRILVRDTLIVFFDNTSNP